MQSMTSIAIASWPSIEKCLTDEWQTVSQIAKALPYPTARVTNVSPVLKWAERHGLIEVELADAIIRILDLSGWLGLDIGGAIMEKLAYNQQRADHKEENREKAGGKVI